MLQFVGSILELIQAVVRWIMFGFSNLVFVFQFYEPYWSQCSKKIGLYVFGSLYHNIASCSSDALLDSCHLKKNKLRSSCSSGICDLPPVTGLR